MRIKIRGGGRWHGVWTKAKTGCGVVLCRCLFGGGWHSGATGTLAGQVPVGSAVVFLQLQGQWFMDMSREGVWHLVPVHGLQALVWRGRSWNHCARAALVQASGRDSRLGKTQGAKVPVWRGAGVLVLAAAASPFLARNWLDTELQASTSACAQPVPKQQVDFSHQPLQAALHYNTLHTTNNQGNEAVHGRRSPVRTRGTWRMTLEQGGQHVNFG